VNCSMTRRVIDGDSSPSPTATTRTALMSCSGGAFLSRKPLAPAVSAWYTYSSMSKVVKIRTRDAEIGQRQELDVGVVEAASDCDRLAKQCLARLRVGFFEGLDDQHPTVLGSILTRLLEDGAGPCEPSASDGPVAEDVAGDPGERTCRPAGGHGVALPTVDDVGALVVHGGSEVLALQIQRFGKAFERLTRLGYLQSDLEHLPGGPTVASTQRRQAVFDQGGVHQSIMA
jgi:hypothetical protein